MIYDHYVNMYNWTFNGRSQEFLSTVKNWLTNQRVWVYSNLNKSHTSNDILWKYMDLLNAQYQGNDHGVFSLNYVHCQVYMKATMITLMLIKSLTGFHLTCSMLMVTCWIS